MFSHLEKNPYHCALRENSVPAVESEVFQASKHLLTSKRKAEEAASLTDWSMVCPQGKGDGGGVTRVWYTWLAANYNFSGLEGIPRVARLVLQT